MLVLVAGCSRGPAPAQLSATPNSDTIATPPPIQSGVTILADGVVQPAQPVLPLAFDFGGKLLELQGKVMGGRKDLRDHLWRVLTLEGWYRQRWSSQVTAVRKPALRIAPGKLEQFG